LHWSNGTVSGILAWILLLLIVDISMDIITLIMEIIHKPWEWVTETKDGSYNLVKADEETRKKQLEEFKKRRKIQLKKNLITSITFFN